MHRNNVISRTLRQTSILMSYLHMKRLFVLLGVLLLGVSSLHAQKRYDELTYPKLGKIEKPAVTTFTAKNGITFYLVEDHELPLINVNVIVRTGEVQVPDGKVGLTTVVGDVMRSGGTETYPADSLNRLLEDKAARMETGIGFTSGSANMNVLKEDFDELLPVFVDLMSHPAFPKDKIELAKKQIKTSISRRNDQQSSIAQREFNRLIYGKNSVYGRLTQYETVNNITRQDLINFHKQAFVGKNLMIGVIGDFKTKDMKKKLQKAFASMPAGSKNDLDFPKVDYQYKSTVNLINKPDVNQSYILMGHIGGLRENPDYPALQVMNEVLSGGFSGRLFQRVRTDLGLAYSVFGQYSSNTFYPGEFYAGVMTKSATTAEAIDAIRKQIERMQNEPISQKELQDTKDRFLNSLVFRYDSKDKILSQRMSYAYRGMPKDTFDKYVDQVKAVTVDDVQRVAKKYLHPEQLQILVVGNKEEIGDQLQKYGKVNNIDISIPEPKGEAASAQKGDVKQGKTLLGKMSKALIDTDTELRDVTVVSQTTQFNPNLPQGKMNIGVKSTTTFPDQQHAELQTPQGTLTMEVNGDSGKMIMMGQERPLPPQQVKQIKAEMNRDYLSIARRADKLDAEYMGTEKVDGKEYKKLKVNLENPVTFLIDPDTNLPYMMRYSRFNAQLGKRMKVETHYSNWKEQQGVTFAFKEVSFADGKKSSESDVKNVEINK